MNQFINKVFCQSKGWLSASLTSLTAISLATNVLTPPAIATIEDSPKTIVDEVWQIVNREFVDGDFNKTNWLAKRQALLERNYVSKQEAYAAIKQALKDLGDPYTRFLPPEEFQVLTSQTNGALSGIGIVLEIDQANSNIVVIEPLDNSPALKAGIKPGDKILKINGKPTSLMTLEQASEEIRGEVGTKVSLQISRGGKQTLDLRNNPGGLLFASVDIARMWLDSGTIVETINRRGGHKKFSANHSAITDSPLVVLVNRNSASASEIVAGALKDNKRATIVGTKTYGKGTVQSVHSLADGSGLAVTISRYFPPSGADINGKGISPDIEVPITRDINRLLQTNPKVLATTQDPQYAKAIELLKLQN
ncbi:MAG: PDZ domain-containing protein [Cyanobacteria bacterium J083]|nr:MAG: PDZ domain-containing protein [Cyanobacteria bacterium J083]